MTLKQKDRAKILLRDAIGEAQELEKHKTLVYSEILERSRDALTSAG